ncbi:transporter [[Flexibacter] sp. ATCC 35208]|uniref:transporter n=1 Tax=[Flexibacter] sp. ATCC 35208 TaxID=1936242 RepID=UPI0009D11416|nr:transporter [[Flexibacter] sp. ATCC 35208]OMP77557.1 hypothetical protein BW716_19365 [[Flexibacter] sp. ATCC 35208]
MEKKILLSIGIICLQSISVSGQSETEDLAKKLANPIASLISLPLQNNIDYGIGSFKGSRYTLNIQPVIPLSLSQSINLITRVIVPVVSQYNISGMGAHESGLSDIVASAFFSPKKLKNGFTWGAGPVLLFPTGTNDFLTANKFGIGPTVVALKQSGGLTYGSLINQIWSLARNDERPNINQMFVNPFISFNWKSGAGLTAQLEWTQNWTENSTTLYFEPMFSGLTSFGSQKVSLSIGPRINLAAPEGTESKFGIRAGMALLFPK